MKKLLLGLFVVLAFGFDAQIEKGKLFVGGSFGLNSSGGSYVTVVGGTTTEVEAISDFEVYIIPQVGFMITENIGAGLGVGYGFSQTTIPDFFDNGTDLFDQVRKTGTISISPFTRYYKKVAEKFYLFGELSFPIDITSQKDLMWNNNFDGVVDNDETYSYLSYGFGLGLGANYFVSNNIALEARFNVIGLNYITYKSTVVQANGDEEIIKGSYFLLNSDTNNLIDISSFMIGLKIFL